MKILVSNIMMLNERDRFDRILRDRGFDPIWPDVAQFLDEGSCLSHVGAIDGWLAGDDRITRRVLGKAVPRLRVISKWGTGTDSIDKEAAAELGIPVCNCPGAFSDAVAEVAVGYMLMLSRGLSSVDRAVRGGEWPKPRFRELTGRTLGMIGFGAIGKGIACRAAAFGMSVNFFDPLIDQLFDGGWWQAGAVSLEEIIVGSDIVCLACNLTPQNVHLVDESFLTRMKAESLLVNVSRGPLIDEPALCEALRRGIIAGAGLDVFEEEPLPASSPLRLMDNVVLGSHNANNGQLAVERVHNATLSNLYKYFPGAIGAF